MSMCALFPLVDQFCQVLFVLILMDIKSIAFKIIVYKVCTLKLESLCGPRSLIELPIHLSTKCMSIDIDLKLTCRLGIFCQGTVSL